jgi:hypothetical protein
MPRLYRELKARGGLVELTQSGCHAGLLLADNNVLDALVSEGNRHGLLRIDGLTTERCAWHGLAQEEKIQTLDDYLLANGALLGKQAERSLKPLHVPGRDHVPALHLLRDPFEAQAHVITAARKALQRQKALLLVGEMGTGKTLMGLAAVHTHAAGRPYRALVFCPGQLVPKWAREIRETILGAAVIPIESWKNLLHLNRASKPTGVEWYLIASPRWPKNASRSAWMTNWRRPTSEKSKNRSGPPSRRC